MSQLFLMPVFVDSNVIFDIANRDPIWLDWSLGAMERFESEGFIINAMVYAELSCSAESATEVDELLVSFGLTMAAIPRDALFLAAKAHLDYRKRGGTRRTGLPDFFIGAHAFVEGVSLLTRDKGRYKTYFPELDLISPESGEVEDRGGE